MNNSQLKYQIKEVISFGRFYNLLNAGECILLHQWAQLGKMPATKLKDKFFELKERIKLEKWELPEYQYNTQLKLTYKTKDMENFVAVPNEY